MTASEIHTLRLPDEAATAALAASWAASLSAPLSVWLEGGLGAGKTAFCRSLIRALGYTGTVKSPTYTIAESYPLPDFTVHHFDLYRFSYPEEWEDAGLDELVGNRSICLIEWPEKGGSFTPPADIVIRLHHAGSGRTAAITAHSNIGNQSLTLWKKNIPEGSLLPAQP